MKNKLLITLGLITACTFVNADDSKKQTEELLDNVRKDLTALSAQFEQYEIDANNHQSEASTGDVWLRAPDQFKWEYKQPVPQLIVANGKKVWVYDEDLEQVTIKQQNSKQNPIYVLLNKELSEKNYQISFDEQATTAHKREFPSADVQWIKMLPNQVSDEVKVVWLGIEDNKITTLKLQNQLDNTVVFTFKNVIKNPELPDAFFDFDVPKGTDVISDAADIGEF